MSQFTALTLSHEGLCSYCVRYEYVIYLVCIMQSDLFLSVLSQDEIAEDRTSTLMSIIGTLTNILDVVRFDSSSSSFILSSDEFRAVPIQLVEKLGIPVVSRI